MILLIDNFDSFTYNIFQYLRKMNYEVIVRRNNEISIDDINEMRPSHIIISPGPGTPDSAGICVDVIKQFKEKMPILGICLGHQCIGKAFGAEIIHAKNLYHGKPSDIMHNGKSVFNGIKNPFVAIRYHSLVIKKESIPEDLEITATSNDGEIMGVKHKNYSVEGVQFHPESIGTEFGFEILNNFVNYKPESVFIKQAIKHVVKGKTLSEEDAQKVMDEITSGKAKPAQIASFLTAISLRGETVEEITGFAKIMRKKATIIKKPEGRKLIDTCGTGGDAQGTFNISTVSAFVVAGAGLNVAKHGNRSVTSRCGSADVLEILGVNIAATPEVLNDSIDKIGLAFLFAPKLHESMKHAVPVRQDIGIRTAFNILGPLSNPASADYQIIGVYEEALTEKIAKVLINLGIERALVVHGLDGLDEITLTCKTKISEISNGWIHNYFFDPKDFGFDYCNIEDLKGGDLRTNAEILLSVLKGEKGFKRDIVVINSAAAILLTGLAKDFKDAIKIAQDSIDQGHAMKKLDELIRASSVI